MFKKWLSTVDTNPKLFNHQLYSHNTTKTSSFSISLNQVGDELVHSSKKKVALIKCVNGVTIRLKRNTQGDPILTENACNQVNWLTIKADRNCSSQCIHVHEDSHQHHQNPVALVVYLQKNKLHECESAMNKILSLPTTAGGLFVKKNLAKKSSGLAVEVGFGYFTGKQNKSVKTGIKN